jgi:hypothetical protein
LALADIDYLLELPNRKLVVAENDIDLTLNTENTIFILMVEASPGSAGGRGGGSGSRKINRILGFACDKGVCIKTLDTIQEAIIEQFDIPYSAVAMDIKLSTGKSLVIQGLTDSELIKSYTNLVNKLK